MPRLTKGFLREPTTDSRGAFVFSAAWPASKAYVRKSCKTPPSPVSTPSITAAMPTITRYKCSSAQRVGPASWPVGSQKSQPFKLCPESESQHFCLLNLIT